MNVLTGFKQWWNQHGTNYYPLFSSIRSKLSCKKSPSVFNQKTFSDFFIAFLKCAWNLENFPKKDEYPSLIISEIIAAEKRGYLNVLKVLLQNTIR